MTEQIIQIGISKLIAIKKMAELLKFADTKEDIMLILEKMHDELNDGLTEIDKINKIKEE